MTDSDKRPALSFSSAWTKRDDFEPPAKGYRNDRIVELPDGRKFPVYFYEPGRLQQDLEYEKIIAEVGLIILEEVTLAKMEEAVYKLWAQKYFDNFKPLDR